MDVLHDACFHAKHNYRCMISGEALSKAIIDPKLKADIDLLTKKLNSSQNCKYQSGKYKGTKFIEKISYKLEAASHKKLVKLLCKCSSFLGISILMCLNSF